MRGYFTHNIVLYATERRLTLRFLGDTTLEEAMNGRQLNLVLVDYVLTRTTGRPDGPDNFRRDLAYALSAPGPVVVENSTVGYCVYLGDVKHATRPGEEGFVPVGLYTPYDQQNRTDLSTEEVLHQIANLCVLHTGDLRQAAIRDFFSYTITRGRSSILYVYQRIGQSNWQCRRFAASPKWQLPLWDILRVVSDVYTLPDIHDPSLWQVPLLDFPR